MKKQTALITVNLVLLISFTIQAVAGVALFFYPGPEALVQVHRYNGLAFVVLALLHTWYNRGWIRANFLTR